MYEFLSGAIMLACFVIAIFFIRFWKKTHDKLFLTFASAFWILGLERLVLGYLGTNQEHGPKVYLIRLTAFVLILFAIIQKNRETSKEG